MSTGARRRKTMLQLNRTEGGGGRGTIDFLIPRRRGPQNNHPQVRSDLRLSVVPLMTPGGAQRCFPALPRLKGRFSSKWERQESGWLMDDPGRKQID